MLTAINPIRSGKPSLPSQSILVIDSDETSRDFLEQYLSAQGYNVRLAEDGEHAIDIFRQSGESYTAVLLEICLPGFDGPKTLRVLREIGMESPVVFMSGDLADYPTESLEALGCSAILVKPFPLADLEDILSLSNPACCNDVADVAARN